MKCEICHEKAAETAIGTDGNGEELYVCKACAEKERKRRLKRRDRTRKTQEAAVQSGEQQDGAPPILKAFLNAVTEMVGGIESAIKSHESEELQKKEDEPVFAPLKGVKIAAPFAIHDHMHLEGLFLIGEIEAVRRAVECLGLRLDGISVDGISDSGHAYQLLHCNNQERAKRVMNAIITQERNARIRLFNEMSRVFSDSLCRALAILKNCRLLSVGEYFDLLSPLRLAASTDMLDGIKLREIERMMKSLKRELDDHIEPTLEEREASDAERADEANRRFEDVVIND